MSTLVALALALLPAPAQEAAPGKCFVKDGRTGGVFYGMSILADLWGNFRRQVWTLKADGTLIFGPPEGGFEDFAGRPLTEGEKASAGTYSFDGAKFFMTYRDGSKSEGSVEYHPDGAIKRILASGLNIFPVIHGPGAALSGYWSNTFSFNNAALKMSTTVYNNYSFLENGIFVHESGAGTIATGVRERTRETSTTIETVREEVTKFYGGDPASKMGKFEIRGSSLRLSYDNGTRTALYIGRIGEVKPGEKALLLIGSGLYSGVIGGFPAATGAAAAPKAVPEAGLGRCTTPQFDLAVPAGWHAREEDLDGTKVFLLSPAGASPEDPEGRITVVLMGTLLDDRSTKASDPGMLGSLESLVHSWCRNEKAEKEGPPEKFRIGGVDASRLKFSLARDGGAVKLEAACAVRDGRALIALTVAGEAAMKRHGAGARALIDKVALAAEPKVELQRASGEGYALDVPKSWTVKEAEQNGTKTLVLVPPCGENEYVVQLIPSDAGAHATAADAGAVKELRDLVKQLAPALEPVGDVETFKAGGQAAAGVVYGGRNDKGEVILVKAYLTLKAKRAVVALVVGQETRDKEYGALVRRALESLTLK